MSDECDVESEIHLWHESKCVISALSHAIKGYCQVDEDNLIIHYGRIETLEECRLLCYDTEVR